MSDFRDSVKGLFFFALLALFVMAAALLVVTSIGVGNLIVDSAHGGLMVHNLEQTWQHFAGGTPLPCEPPACHCEPCHCHGHCACDCGCKQDGHCHCGRACPCEPKK